MQRVPVQCYDGYEGSHPANSGAVYWVDPSGTVYSQPIGGTAWRSPCSIGSCAGTYEYRTRGGLLVLRTVCLDVVDHATPYKAPVVGLRPDYIAVLEYDKARCKEIGEAILRYATAMQPIPDAWLTELSELTQRNLPEEEQGNA
jgi:hypothetical protein